jgi:hypothetical protein
MLSDTQDVHHRTFNLVRAYHLRTYVVHSPHALCVHVGTLLPCGAPEVISSRVGLEQNTDQQNTDQH